MHRAASFGERGERRQEQVSPHPCHDAAMHSLMLGRTLLGERVYDVDRGSTFWRGCRKSTSIKSE